MHFKYHPAILETVIGLANFFDLVSNHQAYHIQCYEQLADIAFRDRHHLSLKRNVTIDGIYGMKMVGNYNFSRHNAPERERHFEIACSWPRIDDRSELVFSVFPDEERRRLGYQLVFLAEKGTLRLIRAEKGEAFSKVGCMEPLFCKFHPDCIKEIKRLAKEGNDVAKKVTCCS